MTLAPGQVELWLAREAPLRAPAYLASLEHALSAEDHARIERMRFPDGRHQQRVTRALARHALSHHLPAMAPSAWRFQQDEFGRPSIASDLPEDARRLHFNLSHTRGLVVMAVGLMPLLGVDVERIASEVSLDVASRYFSAQEVLALAALPEADKPRRFQRLWTLKEAYLKGLGTGISGGLGSMTFHFDEGGVRFERPADADAAYWRFSELEIDGEFLVAVACRPPAGHLAVRLHDYLPDIP